MTTYVVADHLGSGSLFLNSAGTKLIQESYSAFGYRRSADWSAPLSPASSDYKTIASTTRRGYTSAFHEMLDNLGLINMNGRVYDPTLGRFLSPDSLGVRVGIPQASNPYAYARNSPLTFDDPTGNGDLFTGPGAAPDTGAPGFGSDPNEPPTLQWEMSATPGSENNPGHDLEDQEITVAAKREPPESLNYWDIIDIPDWSTPNVSNPVATLPRRPQGNTFKNRLCKAGNSVAGAADSLGNVSGKLELAGLGITVAGFVTAQPEVTAVGLAVAATGGLGNIGAGLLQFGAGLLQGAGGGSFANSGYAALSLATGFTLARVITGPAVSGYRTVSQRAGDAFANGTATVAGGVNDLWTGLIDAASPRQVGCPGGN